jgi:uncharacterized membrane protein YbaN (DUF454 family)
MARTIFLVCGLLALGMGLIGIALPILPTVPFLLLAAFCFARSQPAWEQRLLDHPRYGAALRDWRERQAIRRPAKVAALGAMSAGVVFTGLTIGFPWVLVSVAVLTICGSWIWTRAE